MYLNKSLLILISIICLINLIQPASSQCSCSYPIPPVDKTVKVTSPNGVNIRNKPCLNGVKIASLAKGTRFRPNLDCIGQCVNQGVKTDIWLEVNVSGGRKGYFWSGATSYSSEGFFC